MFSWVPKIPVPKKMPKEGDVRVKRRFLLFPKNIGGVSKWLGVAYWEEQCDQFAVFDLGAGGLYPDLFWEPTKWISNQQWHERKWEEHLALMAEKGVQ